MAPQEMEIQNYKLHEGDLIYYINGILCLHYSGQFGPSNIINFGYITQTRLVVLLKDTFTGFNNLKYFEDITIEYNRNQKLNVLLDE